MHTEVERNDNIKLIYVILRKFLELNILKSTGKTLLYQFSF